MLIDTENDRAFTNPAAMHLYAIVDDCGDDIREATSLINFTYSLLAKDGPLTKQEYADLKHWAEIKALMDGKGAQA